MKIYIIYILGETIMNLPVLSLLLAATDLIDDSSKSRRKDTRIAP